MPGSFTWCCVHMCIVDVIFAVCRISRRCSGWVHARSDDRRRVWWLGLGWRLGQLELTEQFRQFWKLWKLWQLGLIQSSGEGWMVFILRFIYTLWSFKSSIFLVTFCYGAECSYTQCITFIFSHLSILFAPFEFTDICKCFHLSLHFLYIFGLKSPTFLLNLSQSHILLRMELSIVAQWTDNST